MGTNYFLITKNEVDENKHIGKSSMGWQFIFRGYPKEFIFSLNDWKTLINEPSNLVINEYGEIIDKATFYQGIEAVTRKEMLNAYNVLHKVPMNKKERVKFELDKDKENYDSSIRKEWKDDEGYCFFEYEFS